MERGAQTRRARGFTLVELLLALAVGMVVSGVLLQALVGEERISQRLGRHWREKANQRRALELIRAELRQAESVATALPGSGAACGLAGRRVVLHLDLGAALRPVTYSIGAAPSAIWRGAVLMRCGPAFALDGSTSSGAALNRVLLDGLAAEDGFTTTAEGDGVVRLQLRQEFPGGPAGGGVQRITSEAMAVGSMP